MPQKSILPLLGITPIQAFQAALQGTRPTPRTVMTGARPRIVGADVPAAPLRPTPITRADMPLGRAAMSPLAMGASAPLPQDPTMLQRLQADKPFSAGLQAAGEALAQASGYTEQPKDTMSMINQAMAAFNQAQRQQAMIEAQTALSRQQREQEMALEREKLAQAMDIAEMQYGDLQSKAQREADDKKTKREMERSKDFRTESKAFGEARLNYERIIANATTPNPTGATDIALIFNYMKMLDPTSVVRGSEYKAAEDASPFLLMLGQQYNKLFTKQASKLPDQTRRYFLQAATETYRPYIESQKRLEAGFIEEAESFGLDASKIVRTKVPTLGSKDYPHLVYDLGGAENLPVGDWLMFEGTLIQVQER